MISALFHLMLATGAILIVVRDDGNKGDCVFGGVVAGVNLGVAIMWWVYR